MEGNIARLANEHETEAHISADGRGTIQDGSAACTPRTVPCTSVSFSKIPQNWKAPRRWRGSPHSAPWLISLASPREQHPLVRAPGLKLWPPRHRCLVCGSLPAHAQNGGDVINDTTHGTKPQSTKRPWIALNRSLTFIHSTNASWALTRRWKSLRHRDRNRWGQHSPNPPTRSFRDRTMLGHCSLAHQCPHGRMTHPIQPSSVWIAEFGNWKKN